jgi:hypothetical protein
MGIPTTDFLNEVIGQVWKRIELHILKELNNVANLSLGIRPKIVIECTIHHLPGTPIHIWVVFEVPCPFLVFPESFVQVILS